MANPRSTSIWSVVHEERRALIHDVALLTPKQWKTASLCSGWDVHDVVAHFIDSAKTTRRGFFRRMIASGFDFDRDNIDGIAREKAPNPADTLAEFRAVVARKSTPPANLATRLVEVFVHGEDVRQPLEIIREYPPVHVAKALAYQVKTSVKIGGGKELAKGWRLVATDTAFEHGDGLEVRAPAIVLLLAVSGRPFAVSRLSGAGAKTFHHSTKTVSAQSPPDR